MSDTPEVPPVPPVPPISPVPSVEPASVMPPAPPAVPEPARPDPYAQPTPYAQPNPYAQPTPYGQAPYGQAPYGSPGAPAYAPQYGYAQRTNPLAIVAFVLSLAALFIWILGSIAAIICGHIAIAQIKRTGEGGRGFALAGLIIGYSGLALGIIVVVIYVAIIAAAVSSGYTSSTVG